MFGSPILDVAVGIVFLYLLLSLVSSAVNELFEGWLKNRAKDLEKGLRELLLDPNGTGLVKQLYEHPLINGLFQGKYNPNDTGNLPSYIPARNFALAVLDIAPAMVHAPGSAGGGAAAAPAPIAPQGVIMALNILRQDAAAAQQNVETWFNNCMDRVGGWYKRRSQMMLFAIGLCVAVLLNADTITVAKALINDGTIRNSAVAAAGAYLNQQNTGSADERLKSYWKTVSGAGLPIGWDSHGVESVPGRIPADGLDWLYKAIGCLVTACAISLGAPFWFDMLNKVMTARSTIKPKEEGSK